MKMSTVTRTTSMIQARDRLVMLANGSPAPGACAWDSTCFERSRVTVRQSLPALRGLSSCASRRLPGFRTGLHFLA